MTLKQFLRTDNDNDDDDDDGDKTAKSLRMHFLRSADDMTHAYVSSN